MTTTAAPYTPSNPFIPAPTNFVPGTPISPTGYVNTLFGTYPSTSIPTGYPGSETCGYPVGQFAYPGTIGAVPAYGTYPVLQQIPAGLSPYGFATQASLGAWPSPWHSAVSPWQTGYGTPVNTLPSYLSGCSPINTLSPYGGHSPFHSFLPTPQIPGYQGAFTPGVVPGPWNPGAAWLNAINPAGLNPYGTPFVQGLAANQFGLGFNPQSCFHPGIVPSIPVPNFSPYSNQVPGGYLPGVTPFQGVPGSFPFAFNPYTVNPFAVNPYTVGSPFAQPWQVPTNYGPGYPIETNINGQRRNGLNRDAA